MGNRVQIIPPQGFGAINGLRLTNNTGQLLLVDNISSTGQGEEFLFPQEQMVYHTRNVSRVPEAYGYFSGIGFTPGNLFVEWSDDSVNDFIGTYPYAVPTETIINPALQTNLVLNTRGGPTAATPTFAVETTNKIVGFVVSAGSLVIPTQRVFEMEALEVSAVYDGVVGIAQFIIGLGCVVGGVLTKVYAQADFTLHKSALSDAPSDIVVIAYNPRIVIPSGDTPVFLYLNGPAGVSFSASAIGGLLPV
jgi:hypothetical protein